MGGNWWDGIILFNYYQPFHSNINKLLHPIFQLKFPSVVLYCKNKHSRIPNKMRFFLGPMHKLNMNIVMGLLQHNNTKPKQLVP